MAKIADSLRLDSSEIENLLSTESRIRIATLDSNSEINLTPMTFGYAKGLIYIFGRGQKVVNLRRNPTATVLVDVGEKWPELKGIMIRGTAKVLETESEELADASLRDAQLNLGQKHGLSKNGEIKPYSASASGRTRRWIVFEPATVVSWDNSKLES